MHVYTVITLFHFIQPEWQPSSILEFEKKVECIEVEYIESDSLQRRNHLSYMLCVVEATAPSGPLWLLRN